MRVHGPPALPCPYQPCVLCFATPLSSAFHQQVCYDALSFRFSTSRFGTGELPECQLRSGFQEPRRLQMHRAAAPHAASDPPLSTCAPAASQICVAGCQCINVRTLRRPCCHGLHICAAVARNCSLRSPLQQAELQERSRLPARHGGHLVQRACRLTVWALAAARSDAQQERLVRALQNLLVHCGARHLVYKCGCTRQPGLHHATGELPLPRAGIVSALLRGGT